MPTTGGARPRSLWPEVIDSKRAVGVDIDRRRCHRPTLSASSGSEAIVSVVAVMECFFTTLAAPFKASSMPFSIAGLPITVRPASLDVSRSPRP